MTQRILRAIWRRMPQPVKELFNAAISPLIKNRLNRQTLNYDISQWQANHRKPVSIVIPSYNDIKLLKKCIRSIRQHSEHFRYEIIIVDDYCQPDNSRKLQQLVAADVTVLFKQSREGFAVTVNKGMEKASHDIVLLNSDTEALHGWLDALQYAAYAIDPTIGLVSGKLLYPNGRIQYGGTFHAERIAPQWFAHLYAGSYYTSPIASTGAYNFGISGACMYVTRNAFQTLGGLDETYWLGFEDVDYAMKAWTSGFKCYYEPRACLIHHESASRGYSQGPREFASMRHFWRTWRQYFSDRSTLVNNEAVELYVSETGTESIWFEYVRQLMSENPEVNVTVKSPTNAKLIDCRDSSDALKIAIDSPALQTVWIESILKGFPLHFIDGDYMSELLSNPSLLSQLKPEFAYISPNPAAALELQRRTAWASVMTVPPAFKPEPIAELRSEDFANRRVCIITSGLDAAPKIANAEVHVFNHDTLAMQDLRTMRELSPRLVISTVKHGSALLPHFFMSIGAAFVGWRNEATALTVLDGENALLAQSDMSEIIRLSNIVLELDEVWSELRVTGYETAMRIHGDALAQWESFRTNPRRI